MIFNFILVVFTIWLIYSFLNKKKSGKSQKKIKPENKNLKPSEKWLLENSSYDDWIEKYNLESIESRYVKQWAQFVFENEKRGLNEYLRFKEKNKDNYSTYDLIWSFFQSTKLSLAKRNIKNIKHINYMCKNIEDDYVQYEKWYRWKLKYLEFDDIRWELFVKSKQINIDIENENDDNKLKVLKSLKKQNLSELKLAREKLKSHKEKNPA